MTDVLVSLLALFGVPAALVTLIALAALTVTRRRTPQAPGWPGQSDDVAARQAWAAAYLASIRLARLEARVRDLERAAAAGSPGSEEWR